MLLSVLKHFHKSEYLWEAIAVAIKAPTEEPAIILGNKSCS